ncbi:MAG: serine hydrolase [Gammaproteobacteria bacterium]|nr:serine hydrolase [Gammaproteobacteria bacterium]
MRSDAFSGLMAYVLMLGAASPAAHAGGKVPWPTHGWSTASPESVGLDVAVLAALDKDLAAGKYGYIDSLLVIRHGRIGYERHYAHDYDSLFAGKGPPGLYNYYDPTWHPFWKRTPLHTMQSVSKSVTSALIGIAIDRGQIPDVNVKVMPYFSDFRVNPDERRDRLRLWDVLTMTTGIRWDEFTATYTDQKNNCAQMEATEDWVQYVLDQPMAAEPGTTFVYNSGATELLSYLIRKTTGKNADDYAKEHLFAPLGIRHYAWKRTPLGLTDTEGGLYLQPRDLAKLGYLYLHDGMWDGKQIIPATWVQQSKRWSIDTHWQERGYGYQWWVLTRGSDSDYEAYAAIGYGGQYLIVIPQLDSLAVVTAWNIYDERSLNIRVLLERIIASVRH